MNDSALIDLDRATDRAWRRYQHALADRMSDLEPGQLVEVMAEPLINELGSGYAPHLQFRRSAETVEGRVSGQCLEPDRGLDKKARRRLVTIGWFKQKLPAG